MECFVIRYAAGVISEGRVAEQTKGGGFRERIYFDAELWHEVERVSAHLRLKPNDLVKMLTALGIAQMKALSQMPGNAVAESISPGAVEAAMGADFEHMTGMSASSPIGGPASGAGDAQPRSRR